MNWGYYIYDDWRVAAHTLEVGDPLGEWLNAYATSLDELAWFLMLLLFELETYWLSYEALAGVTRYSLMGVRIACYFFLANTVYAYIFNYVEVTNAISVEGINNLCALANESWSYVQNLRYEVITPANCELLGSGQAFFQIGGDRVVTDAAGRDELEFLYAVDIQSAIVWLAVVILVELIVQAQERRISGGTFITAANLATKFLYGLLLMDAAIWLWKGHWIYAWDQLLWIGGFAAIGANLSEWREELQNLTSGGAAPA